MLLPNLAGANIFLTDEGNCLKLGDFGSAVKIKAHTTMPGELQGFVGTQGKLAKKILCYKMNVRPFTVTVPATLTAKLFLVNVNMTIANNVMYGSNKNCNPETLGGNYSTVSTTYMRIQHDLS